MRGAGFVQGVKAAGYSLDEAKAAGYRPMDCKAAGFSFDEAAAAGYRAGSAAWNNGVNIW